MPSLEEHCKRTLKRYGVEGRDIHAWLDEPSREYATAHRQFRHDTETIRLVGETFGKIYGKSLAENIALDHVMLDHEEEIKKRATIVVKFPEEKEIPSIPCGYCNTLLKPSDQFCPNCGASRAKIIAEFDKAYEMEKLKIQEKKKKLKEELKKELELRGWTPEKRMDYWKRLRADPRSRSLFPPLARDYAILEKLVQEDLQRDPELEKRYETKVKIENKRKEQKTGLAIFVFLFLILFPAILVGVALHPILGIFWFVFGSVALLSFR